MIISIISDTDCCERRIIYLPKDISCQLEVRWEPVVTDDEIEEDYPKYGLYLHSSDGLDACIFHSEGIEEQIDECGADEDDVSWLFDYLMAEISMQMAQTEENGKHLVELGSVIDRCLEDFPHQVAYRKKEEHA